MIWKTYIRQHPRFGTWYTRAERQPSWVVKLTATVAVLVFVVPIVVLTLAAIVVAMAVFLVASLIASVLGVFTGLFSGRHHPDIAAPPNDGRENVRVIRR